MDRTCAVIVMLLVALFGLSRSSLGAELSAELLPLGLTDDIQIVSSGRSPRPISRIAENLTVLNAEQISRLNAHTLDEILQTVSGIQLFQERTPGNAPIFTMNGALSRHILIVLDGVTQNLLGADETAELGLIPAQRIDRIEIIKGAASTSWGSALGGVINIITKSPQQGTRGSGSVSTSIGEYDTSHLQAEASGTLDRFGYYFSGGTYHSGGVVPDNGTDLDHLYGSATYWLPGDGVVTLGLDYREGRRTVGSEPAKNLRDTADSRYRSARFSLAIPLATDMELEGSASLGRKNAGLNWNLLSPPGIPVLAATYTGDSVQSDLHLTWGSSESQLTAGGEYLHDRIDVAEPLTMFPFLNLGETLDRYGLYLNGSQRIGKFALTPGVRLDSISLDKNFTSYHLGGTWQLTDSTLLRMYAARGYSLPMVNFNNNIQKIWTIQTGFETEAIPYLWLKGTLFYNKVMALETLIVPPDYPASPVSSLSYDQTNRGAEIEARTIPVLNTSLSAGIVYCDAKNDTTGDRAQYIPRTTAKFAAHYDSVRTGLKGTLTGAYVNWPSTAGNQVTDSSVIWHLHMSWLTIPSREASPELFFSVRNLFNGGQYIDNFRPSAPRWVEVGLRFKF